MALSPPPDHWLPGFNFNVEEWDAEGQDYETLAICRTLALAAPRSRLRSRRSRPVHDPPEQDTGGGTAPRRRLVAPVQD
jgi:hypothetical protein